MRSEDLKKQFLSSRDIYTAKRWEGKSTSFKFKYALARYPEIVAAGFTFFLALPVLLTYRYQTFDGSKRDALQKYKQNYFVVRDDDPRLEEIKREKEVGREFFPQ